MKDQVQSCHLTKFDAFGVNRDEVIDFETWLKSIQMSVMLRQHPPKPYKPFNFFLILLNMGKHTVCDFHLIFFQW